jgi:GT2 family glycosyltransferase
MISVVNLIHNRDEMSYRCLVALSAALRGLPHEVICVDNASTESLSSVTAAGHLFSDFRILRFEESRTFASANNCAVGHSKYDWLLFLNNDVMPEEESVAALLEAVQVPGVGAAGAKLCYPDGRIQHAGMAQMLWGYASNFGVGALSTDPRFCERSERFALTAAMLCISRELFDLIGGFDERFIWGYEDVDLCLKVRAAGRLPLFEPAAGGTHLESATLRDVRLPSHLEHNYRLYREIWDEELRPRESAYLLRLYENGIRRVVILGAGVAARGLADKLEEGGIEVVAFTSTTRGRNDAGGSGRPYVPLNSLKSLQFDRLLAGTQFYFQLEEEIAPYDPTGSAVFPILT